jgi:hypothetical protein
MILDMPEKGTGNLGEQSISNQQEHTTQKKKRILLISVATNSLRMSSRSPALSPADLALRNPNWPPAKWPWVSLAH